MPWLQKLFDLIYPAGFSIRQRTPQQHRPPNSGYSVHVKLPSGQRERPIEQMPSLATNPAHGPSSRVLTFATILLTAFATVAACSGQMQMQTQSLAQSRMQASMQAQNHVQQPDQAQDQPPDQPQNAPDSSQGPPRNPPMRDFLRRNAAATPQPSTLPPTQPTSMPAANTLPSPIAATSLPQSNTAAKPHHARVTYNDGLIDVRADDSSLNQILRSISRATGLQITGGVADQRVFGNYGPASTSEIIATLLDGTGTNILLTEGDATTPPRLVLTPRGGGATPPSPNAAGADDDVSDDTPQPASLPQNAPATPMRFGGQAATAPVAPQNPPANPLPEVSGPRPVPPPQNNVLGSDQNVTPTASQIPTTNSVPLDAVPTPSTTTAGTGGQGIVDTPNPPPANSTTGSTPATAESIYQQLLQMQQKKQQQTPPAASPAPSPQ